MAPKISRGKLFRLLRTQSALEVQNHLAGSLDEEDARLLSEMAALEERLPLLNKKAPPTPEFRLPENFTREQVRPTQENTQSSERSWWPRLIAFMQNGNPKISLMPTLASRLGSTALFHSLGSSLVVFGMAAMIALSVFWSDAAARRSSLLTAQSNQQALLRNSPHPPRTVHQLVMKEDERELTRFLEENPGLVNHPDLEGNTPIHFAIKIFHSRIAETLARAGADLNARNHQGITPLMLAAINRKPQMVEWLLQQDVDFSLEDDRGHTALFYAQDYGCFDCEDAIRRYAESTNTDMRKP